MEANDALAKGTGILDVLEKMTSIYNKKEYYALFSGEVKTGKSSLINSILGENICTVDGGVCTNTNTIVRYGTEERITVYYAAKDGESAEPRPDIIDRTSIDNYVSEKKNKNNKKNVRLIVVELPNEHLKGGLVLIDTPGLGSLNPLHAATTFSMAPLADVIFLVGSGESELTESEISYVKQLLECSKCQSVIHVLTHMDQGNPSVVLTKNKEHLSEVKDWKEGELQFCMVSNENLKKHKAGVVTDYSTTGFDKFFPLLETIENNIEVIMAKRQVECLLNALRDYGNILNTLLQSFSSPEKAAAKKKQLEDAAARLNEIKKESGAWKTKLNGEIKKLNARANNRIKADFVDVKSSIEEKLQMDEFINNPEQLGGVVSGAVINKTNKLQDYLSDEFAHTYSWLKKETGLSIIQEQLDNIGGDAEKYTVSDDIKIDKVSIYRNAFLSNVFMYGTLGGSVVGGVVGAVVGTVFFPGVGTLAGAEIGAAIAGAVGTLIGGVRAFIKGAERVKAEKRRKIMEAITPQLSTSQSNISTKVAEIITDGETQLMITFSKELDNESATCANVLRGLDSDSQQRKQISDKKRECDKYLAQAATLHKDLTK